MILFSFYNEPADYQYFKNSKMQQSLFSDIITTFFFVQYVIHNYYEDERYDGSNETYLIDITLNLNTNISYHPNPI